jgi:hypothetical protein
MSYEVSKGRGRVSLWEAKRTTGLEPATFGLGSHRTSASQSQVQCRCSQDVATIPRRCCATGCGLSTFSLPELVTDSARGARLS